MFYRETQDTMPDKNGNFLWRPTFVRTGKTVDILDRLTGGLNRNSQPEIQLPPLAIKFTT